MRVGDLVRYKPSGNEKGPLAIIVKINGSSTSYHNRIKVMWAGEEIPIQAKIVSVKGNRISSWVSPKNFEVIASPTRET